MPELRLDPLTEEWIIFSPERALRPADFSSSEPPSKVAHSPFQEGNEDLTTPEILAIRDADTAPNQPGWQARIIPNKYPALKIKDGSVPATDSRNNCPAEQPLKSNAFFKSKPVSGVHDVIVESPNFIDQFCQLNTTQTENIFRLYHERWQQLSVDPQIQHAILFKNEGSEAGASLQHIHSQCLGLPLIPQQTQKHLEAADRYFDQHSANYYADLIGQEQQAQERLLTETDLFTVFCPYFSRFAYETWIIPNREIARFEESTPAEIKELAGHVKSTLEKLNQLLDGPSFNFVIQSAPFNKQWDHSYRWHFRILPRTSQLAGFELGCGMHVNATLPETAAKQLRAEIVSKSSNTPCTT